MKNAALAAEQGYEADRRLRCPQLIAEPLSHLVMNKGVRRCPNAVNVSCFGFSWQAYPSVAG
jgi:hypothetical protein